MVAATVANKGDSNFRVLQAAMRMGIVEFLMLEQSTAAPLDPSHEFDASVPALHSTGRDA